MATISGVTIERNTSGEPMFARIDLSKYGKILKPFFKKIGMDIEAVPYNPEFVKKIKAQESLPGEHIKAADIWK
jgi:hypothetical protein